MRCRLRNSYSKFQSRKLEWLSDLPMVMRLKIMDLQEKNFFQSFGMYFVCVCVSVHPSISMFYSL